MKRLFFGVLMFNLIQSLPLHAAMRKEVTVRVFSKYIVRNVEISGKFKIQANTADKNGNSSTKCVIQAKNEMLTARCDAKKFHAAMMTFVNLQSFIAIKTPPLKRTYRGSLVVYAENDRLILLNKIYVEDYLSGVLGGEMPFTSPEALKAQAVVSRTWIYANLHNHESYDFCDLTHCQVYKGVAGENKLSRQSVKETNGIILTLPRSEHPALVYYHSTCGGKTTNVIGGHVQKGLSIVDDGANCFISPHHRWEFFMTQKALEKIFHKSVTDIHIIKEDASGRALEILLKNKNKSIKMPAWEFYRTLGKSAGWNKLKSTWFTVSRYKNTYIFKGKGLGHGAGLCQWGAFGLAKQGKSYVEILKHYFPELNLTRVAENE